MVTQPIHALAASLRALPLPILIGLFAVLRFSPALGQATPRPPERMTYQGYLVGADGVALGSGTPRNYDIIFRIYNDQTAGELKWAEQQTVTVADGYFSVLLGEGASTGDPRPDLSTLFRGGDASERYVAITVKGIGAGGANVNIEPRLRLLSAPYAYLAQNAVKLVQDTGSDLMTSSGNVLTLSGSLDVVTGQSLEFGANAPGKQVDAGRVGYQLFSEGLDIVGAGVSPSNRKITLWAEGGVQALGPVTATSFIGNGATLSGVAKLGPNTFSGNQHITTGNLQLDNAYTIQGRNASGAMETFIWPRWSDNATYLNYGSGGFNIRNNASATAVFIDNDRRVVFQAGVLARGGYPGPNGSSNAGYAFHSGGDNDSGMFSDQDGYVRFTANNQLKMTVYPGGVITHAPLSVNDNLEVHTGFGKTFQAAGNAVNIFMANNPAKYSFWFRQDNGMYFGTAGGTSQGGGATRYCIYDGDSNWDFNSDRRLKKDIADAEPMLDRAMRVQVRRFRWKEDAADARLHLGVIAQEVQEIFPDMVGEMQDPETGEKSLTVGYSDFGMISIKALQEFKKQHDAEVSELKAELAELKSQMAALLQATAQNSSRPGSGAQAASLRR
jgi:hypothetical protein